MVRADRLHPYHRCVGLPVDILFKAFMVGVAVGWIVRRKK